MNTAESSTPTPTLDTDDPVPAVFPAVAEGERFNFHLICRSYRVSETEAVRLLGLAERCLTFALVNNGVGAKTRADYGHFRDSSQQSLMADPADDLFQPMPVETTLESRTPANPQQPPSPQQAVQNPVEAFVEQWAAGALVPERIKAFADQILKLPANQRMKAFDACMPKERRIPTDSVWQAFKNKHHGKNLLKELNLS